MFIFDEVIHQFPQTKSRLGTDARIVACPKFENRVVKIINKETNSLTQDKKVAVSSLKISEFNSSVEEEQILSLVERAWKRRKLENDYDDQYMNLNFLFPTSNLCERFFSRAGYALTDRRERLSPRNFELEMFLHINSRFWDVDDVQTLVHKEKTAAKNVK